MTSTHSDSIMIPLTIEENQEIIDLSRRRSNQKTAVEFNMRHPERHISKSSVQRVLALLRSTGSLHRKKRNTLYALSNSVEFIDEVHNYVQRHPYASIRQLGLQFNCSPYVIHKIVRKKLKYFPYKNQMHQKLLPQDPILRFQFSQHMLRWHTEQPGFLKKILWSDEKQFTMTASFNRQNHRYDADLKQVFMTTTTEHIFDELSFQQILVTSQSRVG